MTVFLAQIPTRAEDTTIIVSDTRADLVKGPAFALSSRTEPIASRH